MDQLMVGAEISRMLQKDAIILSAVSFFWLPGGSSNNVEIFHLSAPASTLQKTHVNLTLQYSEESFIYLK